MMYTLFINQVIDAERPGKGRGSGASRKEIKMTQENQLVSMTPKESVVALASMADELATLNAAVSTAKENLDDASLAASNAARDALLAKAVTAVASITAEAVKPARCPTLIRAAASGVTPAQLREIAEANRVTSSPDGIVLPAGRLENLSRGKGWCRLGTGASATWGERKDGGYLVATAGKWIVGASDGFSRKDTTPWTVKHIGDFWVAN